MYKTEYLNNCCSKSSTLSYWRTNHWINEFLHRFLLQLFSGYLDEKQLFVNLDGDLDIITVPAAGPIAVYVNNNQRGNAIAFELRDDIGNRFNLKFNK